MSTWIIYGFDIFFIYCRLLIIFDIWGLEFVSRCVLVSFNDQWSWTNFLNNEFISLIVCHYIRFFYVRIWREPICRRPMAMIICVSIFYFKIVNENSYYPTVFVFFRPTDRLWNFRADVREDVTHDKLWFFCSQEKTNPYTLVVCLGINASHENR